MVGITTRPYNALSVKRILEARDFLTNQPYNTRIRNQYLIVHIAGTKTSGKTRFCDTIEGYLREQGYGVCSSRASEDADKDLIDNRRKMLKRQEKGDEEVKWYQVVDALRNEGVSALEKRVLPYMRENIDAKKRGVILLNRYPLIDTLSRQHLYAPVSLEAIAERLRGGRIRGTQNYEPSCYIKPDLVLIFLCKGSEAFERLRRREHHLRTELGVEIGEKIDRIEKQIPIYKKIAGHAQTNSKIFPGQTHVIDTSTEINYTEENPDEITRALEEKERICTMDILQRIILPLLKEK